MIPKILHHVWIGPLPMPMHWMKTWKEKNPLWEWIIWDNEKVKNRKFLNQKHIDYYIENGIWHGAADLIRYEILSEYGGFMPGADSICLEPIDELFTDEYDAYVVYENEVARPGLISPLYACTPNNAFVNELILGLSKKEIMGEPWKTTGNLYMKEMVAKTKQHIKIFPSYIFNPVHFTGVKYKGINKVYGVQQWGTTKKLYGK